jgi:hypothetical protein
MLDVSLINAMLPPDLAEVVIIHSLSSNLRGTQ